MFNNNFYHPQFNMMIGLPGSGKSLYCSTRMTDEDKYFSSDAIRKEIWGDESIQDNPNLIFSKMNERAIQYLVEGYNVFYDATNLTRKDRANILGQIPKFVNKKAIVIWAPYEKCIKRDNMRDRHVGNDIIFKMMQRFQPPFYDEGFNEIEILRSLDPNEEWDHVLYRDRIQEAMQILHENSHHLADTIFDHCLRTRNLMLQKQCNNESLIYSAIFHDCGKPLSKTFKNKDGEIDSEAHYYNHHNIGAYISYGLLKEPNPLLAWLIGNHMEPYQNSRYYKNQIPKYLKDLLDLLHECDSSADQNV